MVGFFHVFFRGSTLGEKDSHPVAQPTVDGAGSWLAGMGWICDSWELIHTLPETNSPPLKINGKQLFSGAI